MFKICYVPELDISPELEQEAASYFQTVIGVLRWMIELGGIDIITEVLFVIACDAFQRRTLRCSKIHHGPCWSKI